MCKKWEPCRGAWGNKSACECKLGLLLCEQYVGGCVWEGCTFYLEGNAYFLYYGLQNVPFFCLFANYVTLLDVFRYTSILDIAVQMDRDKLFYPYIYGYLIFVYSTSQNVGHIFKFNVSFPLYFYF